MALGCVAEIAAGQVFKQGYRATGNGIARKRCNHKALVAISFLVDGCLGMPLKRGQHVNLEPSWQGPEDSEVATAMQAFGQLGNQKAKERRARCMLSLMRGLF